MAECPKGSNKNFIVFNTVQITNDYFFNKKKNTKCFLGKPQKSYNFNGRTIKREGGGGKGLAINKKKNILSDSN